MIRSESRIILEKEQEPSFLSYATMEDLLDKLKLLEYESKLLKELKMKPLHRYYFIIPKNPGEQFYLFSILAFWLIKKMGQDMDRPQESSDPNIVVSNILSCIKANNIPGDFSQSKLKQGVGDEVVYILDQLATLALQKNNFKLELPQEPKEKDEEIELIEDESEINLERVEEEMIAAYSDDSDEENLFKLTSVNIQPNMPEIKFTNTDEENWNLELERVLPRLKVTIRNENRDWRSHLDQMKQYKNTIEHSMPAAKIQLEKLHRDISNIVEKVNNREKYLNRELDTTLKEYRELLDELSKIKEEYSKISGGVAERNRELAKLNDRLETIKQQMEERGSSMTDGTPLVNIKKSVTKIKAEITDMDIRIGVLECILLQTRIRDEKQIENEFGTIMVI